MKQLAAQAAAQVTHGGGRHGWRGWLCLGVMGLAAAGCVSTKAQRQEVQFDPEVVVGDPALEKLNDEELFATGTARFAANESAEAIRYFDRLVERYPDSPHRDAARFQAGLAHQKLEQWPQALEHFQPLADPKAAPGPALDAAFRVAESLYHLDRHEEAAALLHQIAARKELPVGRQIEAQVQEGVCLIELGKPADAEALLKEVVRRYDALSDRSEVSDFFPGQAQFFLGEIYRLYCEAVQLDGNKGVDQLATDLEYKSELLLSAQGHYLRAIRLGNGYWATAAGSRIGALYEHLYDHILHANPPPELNAEEVEIYRDELRKKVRVLLTKAIAVYEETLAAAERVGTSTPFVEKTRESLKRMKDLLLAGADAASGESDDTTAPKGPRS